MLKTTEHSVPQLTSALLLVALLGVANPALAAQAPVPPEHNPPGDIPDTQVFITYDGPGFAMQVPEGWARHDLASGATFNDKYNIISVTTDPATQAATVETVRSGAVAKLEGLDRAVKVTAVKATNLKGGKAVEIDYSINSEPNAVTNKRIRLEDVRYLIFANGKLVTLDMAAPLGADNVDQWNLMANSVRIK